MSEKKKLDQEKELPDWLKDFKIKDLEASADVDIKPRLEIEGLGIENGKDIELLSLIHVVKIPMIKSIDGSGKLRVIDVMFNGIEHQFIAQSGSFRFQLGVWKLKLKLETFKNLIGQTFKLWKQIGTIDTPKFKGKAEVYVLTPIGKTKNLLN